MIDWAKLIDWIIAGGAVALLTAIGILLKQRADARTADRKQKSDSQVAEATAADTISQAAANVVKLQDAESAELKAEAAEMKKEIRALQAEVAALRFTATQETAARIRSEVAQQLVERQLDDMRNKMAEIKASLYTAEDQRARLARENDNLKAAIYNMAIGVQELRNQLKVIGVEPAYELGVPFDTSDPKPKPRTGPLSTQDLRFSGIA